MVIGISGMIACGKSTLAKALTQHYTGSILLEEFAQDDEVFNTFLNWFYQQKPNINIGFQSYIIESLSVNFSQTIEKFKKSQLDWNKNHIFLDRFNLEHYIFAVLNLKHKPKKYLIAFDAMFQQLIDKNENPDLAIFIDIDFETFKHRIMQRGRKSEIDNYKINEQYFKELHALYKDLFVHLMHSFRVDYVVINANDKNQYQILGEAIEIIDNFKFKKNKDTVG
ncbi:deoxynucleoside kinase [Mycoplasmopsis phocirhinis]|uniref:Deoxynucleoside kinase n=1 Tax=Mycoplasmopsis phocirhinis TaxID=142650 RepID=A0A4P6MST3_9BACT|nr:deoxynucleoside kinase [Mycoplasmopsis phocirhinis]QBF34754.1 deoxynucleoside kinase [Mycoplasmopsis phocirhinis]